MCARPRKDGEEFPSANVPAWPLGTQAHSRCRRTPTALLFLYVTRYHLLNVPHSKFTVQMALALAYPSPNYSGIETEVRTA